MCLQYFSPYLYLHSLLIKIFEFHETSILNFCQNAIDQNSELSSNSLNTYLRKIPAKIGNTTAFQSHFELLELALHEH